jgi:hypothetical protein
MDKNFKKGILERIFRVFPVSGNPIGGRQDSRGVTFSEFNERTGIPVFCGHDQTFVVHLFQRVAYESAVVCGYW